MDKSVQHKIYKYLREELDTDRYIHSMGVAYTAASLAMTWDYPVENALIAGLLHDCAKNIPNDKKILLCDKNHIPITPLERKNPFLIHGRLGAYITEDKFDIHEREILDSIIYHTTGRPEMTLLDKIIYIADYIEPNRHKAANLSSYRKLAFQDLDETLYRIMQDVLVYLQQGGGEIDDMTQQAYTYYDQQRRLQNG